MGSTFFPKIMSLFSLSLVLLASTGAVRAVASYANDFVDPDLIVNGNFGKHTLAAQKAIIESARQSTSGGPWCMFCVVVTGG